MQIIIPTASLFVQVVGKQKSEENQVYRLMTYVLQYPVKDGVLLYHTLTCCLLLLTREEASNLSAQRELIDYWFLVPQHYDDQKLCRQVRQLAQLFLPRANTITDFNIVTTTACNAQCFYCFEKGTKPVTMTVATAKKVSDFIITNRGEEHVTINWFGGEPLVNSRIIDQICLDLNRKGIPYSSTMVSNGYLFDAEMVKRANELWRLTRVQITLDGTAKTYNRTKSYKNGDDNAFERVIQNIELLTASGIHVLVRLNAGTHNIEDLEQLVTYLHQRFEKNEKLSVYSHELLGSCYDCSHSQLFEKRMQLDKLIADYGYSVNYKLPRELKVNRCMSDNDKMVLISPNGDLGKCEHYIDRDFFGHIDKAEKDERIILKFKKRPEDIDACASCAYYPQCFRLLQCPNGYYCTPEMQKENIHKIQLAIKDEYQHYLTKLSNETLV